VGVLHASADARPQSTLGGLASPPLDPHPPGEGRKGLPMTQASAKKSDLGVRSLSAVVMFAVAGTALWLGALVWTVFVLLLGFGVVREWVALATGFNTPGLARLGWVAAGAIYCGLAVTMLVVLREGQGGILPVLTILLAVICTDIGAYFAGRTFGGPKIAPKVSPSKTWAGLVGGSLAAVLAIAAVMFVEHRVGVEGYYQVRFGFKEPLLTPNWMASLVGVPIAIIAQAGDFFESWMKRRAGVKDSGALIPGHGGLFDRVDGLLAVLFVIGVLYIIGAMMSQ
jgi:phosphatidate cytidylyltransferase